MAWMGFIGWDGLAALSLASAVQKCGGRTTSRPIDMYGRSTSIERTNAIKQHSTIMPNMFAK